MRHTKYVVLITAVIISALSALLAFSQVMPFGPVFNTGLAPVASPFLWLSADCITYVSSVCGVPSNGTSITTWADRSGNGNTATTTVGTETFLTGQINGQPAVQAAGAPQAYMVLTTTIPSASNSYTIFAVMKAATATGGNNTDAVYGNPNGSLQFYIGQSGKQNGGGIAVASINSGTAAQDTNWHQQNMATQGFSIAGGLLQWRLDRASDGSPGIGPGQDYTVNSNIVMFGNAVSSYFAEVIVYTSVLSGPQITQNENYFLAKYGL